MRFLFISLRDSGGHLSAMNMCLRETWPADSAAS